jgi:hypothetical protein
VLEIPHVVTAVTAVTYSGGEIDDMVEDEEELTGKETVRETKRLIYEILRAVLCFSFSFRKS